jgi:CubicO group peptidase (beta-lactamase class C family)
MINHIKKNKDETADVKINNIMARHKIPGMSIAIIENGKTKYVESFGYKCNTTKNTITKETLFEAASLSKPVFAYGVLKMVANGRLDLDVPLSNYIEYPNVIGRIDEIIARMVLSHTTGFPNWRAKSKNLRIYFKPGTRFSYSGEGYIYLQKVIEKLSKQSLEVYMQKNVLQPLGMSNSSFIWHSKADYSCGHNASGKPKNTNKNKQGNAAFSLKTTASDYAKFMCALIREFRPPIKPTSMLTQQTNVNIGSPFCISKYSKNFDKTISWGLGVGLQKIKKTKIFWHWGDNPGFESYMLGSSNGDGIVIFANSYNGMKAISDIIRTLKGIEYTKPIVHWLKYK